MAGPATDAPGAIASIATLPVFFKLRGRRALVAGGTPAAAWKAELLAAAGADVLVVAVEPGEEMVALAATRPDRIDLRRRSWHPDDFVGAVIAIGAFDENGGRAFYDAARTAGVPVNVIDVPSLCDFQFGTIVERSPLVISISTDGAAPVLGQALRARIEALLPPEMGAWARAASAWRGPLQALKLGFPARRRFWERFAEMALEGGSRGPTEDDRKTCMEAALATEKAASGRIILVGIGPGDPALVTLAAVRALQTADVILFEEGTATATLGLGRREARRLPAPPDADHVARAHSALGLTVAWVGPGDGLNCSVWVERAARLHASAASIECARGIRCDRCPIGCAANPDQ